MLPTLAADKGHDLTRMASARWGDWCLDGSLLERLPAGRGMGFPKPCLGSSTSPGTEEVVPGKGQQQAQQLSQGQRCCFRDPAGAKMPL